MLYLQLSGIGFRMESPLTHALYHNTWHCGRRTGVDLEVRNGLEAKFALLFLSSQRARRPPAPAIHSSKNSDVMRGLEGLIDKWKSSDSNIGKCKRILMTAKRT